MSEFVLCPVCGCVTHEKITLVGRDNYIPRDVKEWSGSSIKHIDVLVCSHCGSLFKDLKKENLK